MPAVPLLPMLLSSLFTPPAAGFCGTYVGGAGAELYNAVAQVGVVRMGTRTTLSLSNDVHGDTSRFALVLPVPEVVTEEDVHVLPKHIFDRLGRYSEPRLVEYVCADFADPDRGDGGADGGDGADGGGGGGGGSVDVEAEYIVGEYRVVVLSAEESGALFTWLEANGYAVPAAAVPMLQEYIDQGQLFLAAKVDEGAGIASGDLLSPLQISYTSGVFGLPIRIGTLNSQGVQDLIIYGLNRYADGRLGISNYPEIAVEDECMWEPTAGEDFGEFYAARFTDAWASAGAGAWAVEYAWGEGHCDPCSGDPPDVADLVTLGFDARAAAANDFFLTRVHMRYTPDQATQDLALYQSGITRSSQLRYIAANHQLEDRFPSCVDGWAEDPGSCGELERARDDQEGGAGADTDGADAAAATTDPAAAKGGGCASGGTAALGLGWAVGAAALGGRRRRGGGVA